MAKGDDGVSGGPANPMKKMGMMGAGMSGNNPRGMMPAGNMGMENPIPQSNGIGPVNSPAVVQAMLANKFGNGGMPAPMMTTGQGMNERVGEAPVTPENPRQLMAGGVNSAMAPQNVAEIIKRMMGNVR